MSDHFCSLRRTITVSGSTWYDWRRNVEAGWHIYTAVTALTDFPNTGTGDLMGPDHTGVLWYYADTGNITRPFGARTRVGRGWNTYTLIAGANDVTGDGHLARDSAGVLWLYRGTGNPTTPFTARTRVDGGWNTYNLLTQAGDMTGDGLGDLLARDTAGRLWLYRGTGHAAAPYAARVATGTGWVHLQRPAVTAKGSSSNCHAGSNFSMRHDACPDGSPTGQASRHRPEVLISCWPCCRRLTAEAE